MTHSTWGCSASPAWQRYSSCRNSTGGASPSPCPGTRSNFGITDKLTNVSRIQFHHRHRRRHHRRHRRRHHHHHHHQHHHHNRRRHYHYHHHHLDDVTVVEELLELVGDLLSPADVLEIDPGQLHVMDQLVELTRGEVHSRHHDVLERCSVR